jgi:hypothetical protein
LPFRLISGQCCAFLVGFISNDLHCHCHDICDFADACECEEFASLLVCEKFRWAVERNLDKEKPNLQHSNPTALQDALEFLFVSARPTDALRRVNAHLVLLPKTDDHNITCMHNIADHMMAPFGSVLIR